MRPLSITACLLLTALALAGCGAAPSPPAPPAPPAPPTAASDTGHHELQGAIDAVDQRDKAAHAADPVMDADKEHDKQLEDAGG
jgi:hypothetical protein